MIIPVLPLRLEFAPWTEQLRIATPGFYFPVLLDNEDWWGWGEQVVLSNNFTNVPIPTRNVFPKKDDWRRWGAFLIQSLYATTN